ncbi:MAG TPA: hypothetical protein VK615_09505 [Candidatus Binatia bacterium]|nr:hypothetical protein [Candidatus Binatia bacterium]
MLVNSKQIVVTGRLLKTAKLKSELYENVTDPDAFCGSLKESKIRADIFTFLQPADRSRSFSFYSENDPISVMPITTYENWWNKQINGKTRNMIRKAEKAGVQIRVCELTDEFVKGIQGIYNESPLRQGKRFLHYGKDLETLRQAHVSYADIGQFVGAFYKEEMIGFIKLVHAEGMSHLMQIISKVAERDKAPTNALIAKAVELCAARGVSLLHYGLWSARGLGEFKKHHAFERYDLARYFVPLNVKGKLMLQLKMHRKISERLPEKWADALVDLRTKWNTFRYGTGKA